MMRFFTLWVAGLLLTQFAAQGQNVGIGTTSPTQTLDVNGQLRVRGLSGGASGTRLPQLQPDGTLGVFALPAAASDPYAAQPVLLNSNPAGGNTGGALTDSEPFGLAVSGTVAYVVNYDSGTLQVFDVSTPASPRLLGAVSTDKGPRSVAVSGPIAYVLNQSNSTLQTFDVSTATSPRLLGAASTDFSPNSVVVSGTTAYVVGNSSLQVFDASEPASPRLLGAAPTGGGSTSVAVSGPTAYVVNQSNSTLQTFDVSTATSPRLLGAASTDFNPTSVVVSGTTAYVVNYNSGTLQVFDVSMPAIPKMLGSVPTSGGLYSVAVSGTTACAVNNYNSTLQVFDVSTPASPRLLGSAPTGMTPTSVAVSGTTAYVVTANGSTLQAFQISSAQALGLQADGSLGLASAPRLTLSGQTLGLVGGNSVTLPSDNLGNHTATRNLDLATYQLVGNGGSRGLSIGSGGGVGIGTGTPYSLLANTSQNIIGSDNQGGNAGSLTWLANQSGYAGQFYNAGGASNASGLAVKITSTSAAALDVSLGSSADLAGTSLLRVLGSGRVGIGTSSPAATLDVAGSTRLRDLTTAGVVTTDASGNLGSAAASSLGDNLGNHTATQNLNLNNYSLTNGNDLQTVSVTAATLKATTSVNTPVLTASTSVSTPTLAATTSVTTPRVNTPGVFTSDASTHNMLATAYGTVGSSASSRSSSGNYTVGRTPGASVGSYRLTFTTDSGLSGTNLGTAAVTALLFNAVGLISYNTGTGFIDIFTYNASGVLADRGFSFSLFLP